MFMHLNEKGWGFGQMFFMMGILCVALLYVCLNAYKITDAFTEVKKHNNDNVTVNVPRQYYMSLEEEMKKSAIDYIENHYIGEKFDRKIIQYSYLKELKLVNVLIDKYDNSECDGYVIVYSNTYKPYINCHNYMTEGY